MWSHHRCFLLLVMMTLVGPSWCYFTYHDCSPQCVARRMSCTIEELRSEHFYWECFDNRMACEVRASRLVVCILENGGVFGGQDIWNDFVERNHSTTETPITSTSTTPKPAPKVISTLLPVILVIIALVSLAGLLISSRIIYQFYRRRNYQPILPNRGYESTIEDIS